MKIDYSKVRVGKVPVLWIELSDYQKTSVVEPKAREAGIPTTMWRRQLWTIFRTNVPVVSPEGDEESRYAAASRFERQLTGFAEESSEEDWVAIAEGLGA